MSRYCIYLRKSRSDMEAETRGEGETLARHERALLELAKKMHINIETIYKEIISGETISARPVMQKLLLQVEEGIWDGVLVMEVERLARGNTIDQGLVAQAFKLSDTKIITPMKVFDPNNEFDEEYFEFGLFMSRREYKTINRRLQRGRVASVKEGKYVSNKAPYGYKRVKLENEKGFTLEPNSDESNIIKLIFNLYTVGELQGDGTYDRLGTGLISNKLNSMKIPPKYGKDWVPSTIRDILINPVYIGKIRWNWRPVKKKIVDGEVKIERPRSSAEDCIIADGRHPAIIEEKVFYLAQDFMLKNPPRPVGEHKTVKNPLSGLVICGKCGRKMIRRPYSENRNPDTLMCAAKTCNNISSALNYVEEKILASLEEWLREYKLDWNSAKDKKLPQLIKEKENTIKRLEKEIKKIEQQMNNIHDLLEQGIYSVEMFLERSSVNSKKIEQLKSDKSVLESDLVSAVNHSKNKKNIVPKIENLLEVYKNLETPKAKNDMLKQVLEKVIYIKEKNGRWHNSPDDFEIILYPKLPDSTLALKN